MTESKAERFDAVLRWNAISAKRREELGVILCKFHLEDLRAGRVTTEDAAKMFCESRDESRCRYDASPPDWAMWVYEQTKEAKRIEQSMAYALHLEKFGDDVRPDRYVCLDLTRAECYLESIEDIVDVPAYPKCYRPNMNWAASDWMLLHEVPDGGKYPRSVSYPRIVKLPKKLNLLKEDQAEGLHYCVLQLVNALTDPLNDPDGDKYGLARPQQGKKNQVSKGLREAIPKMLGVPESTMVRWLKNMKFEHQVGFPERKSEKRKRKAEKRKAEELAVRAKNHELVR